jgi:hypothetical protein
LDRIDVHVVAYEIAPYQNGMVAIMIPQIRFSDRPLTREAVLAALAFAKEALRADVVYPLVETPA